ncbi:hypothetical protein F1880_009799 [Penicillium rolfsii]|nr:hypothetical protein F1880_009799 [Penicillium rolfsii]
MEIASEIRVSAQDVIPSVDTLKIFVFDPPTKIDWLRLQGLMEMEDGKGAGSSDRWSQGLGDPLRFIDTNPRGKSTPATGALKANWETFYLKIRIKPSSNKELQISE